MEDYLTPGFRFYPTEEELVSFYLHNKLEDGRDDLKQVMDQIIPVLDIYDFNPWNLPRFAGEVCGRDEEQWFFFVPMHESEARGGRAKRLTITGYWKATGSPSQVYSSNHRSIGVKRTMVFYNGRAPTGTKTQWKMNEYKAIHVAADPSSSSSATAVFQLRQEFSLCRIYKRSKTLRSFDRRPQAQGVETMARSIASNVQVAMTKSLCFTNQPNPTTGADLLTAVISSPNNSSSGDQRDESSRTTAEISNQVDVRIMEAAYEPMWDWEQLNWF
ncbi:NAC domain-containing protein 90-like [Momordica charantia]|uniref:NAC domain-containing protein 90-like n=1 Tax=Momordica charantia TaxID=3673 RepID=A0A6J1BVW3_MOMCH|nr:NAC domain-containing protein 90-like [Momordica charantia]